MGEALGSEAYDLDVNVLLGPGLNIKRNPLCGRNFEYYSEDPIVAGRMAAGLIRGIQSNGISHARSISRLTARNCAARPATPWSTSVPCANCI